MKEWIFTGSVRLRGVEFHIVADTEVEAIAKAKAGDYVHYNSAGAETVDWTINPATCEPNE